MGKASRRQRAEGAATKRPKPAPFVARPFAGLPGETDLVALREIVPAATAAWTLREPIGDVSKVTVATILPLAWPGLHRADGEVLVGLQSGNASGDASRDLAQVLLAAAAQEPGQPVPVLPMATVDTPRLQDLLDESAPFEVTMEDGFDFWVGDSELDAEGRASLDQANESVMPTVKLSGVESCYWCEMGGRAYVRWVLPHDEDEATNALARLWAAHTAGLGPVAGEGDSSSDQVGKLLGAFRASGLLVPVWEVDPEAEPESFESAVAEWLERFEAAVASTEQLTADERRARSGVLSRQITLR